MNRKRLEDLGASILGEPVADFEAAMEALAPRISLHKAHKRMFQEFRGPIFFGRARYRPDVPSGAEDKDGYQSLTLLFGPVGGTHGLRDNIDAHDDFMPDSVVPIGESDGGNLICLDCVTSEILYWDHESGDVDYSGIFKIADDFEAFLKKLEVTPNAPIDTSGIIESESWLDI